MNPTRAALALIVLSLLASSLHLGVPSARAQSVTDAEQAADAAAAQRDDAYGVVSNAAANRDEVEAELFDALTRYDAAVSALADANRRLDQTARALAAAEADSAGVSAELQDQVVAAYMQAVLAPGSIVVGTDTVEQAMVVDHVFAAGQNDSLAQLDQLTIRKADLDELRLEHLAERRQVEQLEAQLATETAHLEELFAQADSALAAAYQAAAEADAAYRAALSDVEKARESEERRRQEEESTTTTLPTPTTDGGGDDGSSTTTTSEPPDDDPPAAVRPDVERWRSTVSIYFPAARVDEALLIIQCESHGDPNAVNPFSGAAGLFQFLPGTWAVASVGAGLEGASVYDPTANIAAAAWLAGYYQANGSDYWAPWACRYYL
jgi:hypothetical protein